jgi:hypothetical protein
MFIPIHDFFRDSLSPRAVTWNTLASSVRDRVDDSAWAMRAAWSGHTTRPGSAGRSLNQKEKAMKRFKKSSLVIGVMAAVTMLIAPAAFATNTLSVDGTTSPAGNVSVTGANVGTLSFVTDFGVPASCSASSVAGYVQRGATVASGNKIGAITNLAFGSAGSPCTATGLNYPVVIEKSTKVGHPAEWGIYATATPAKGAASVPIEIRGVVAKMHSTTPATPTPSNKWACDLQAGSNLGTTVVAGTFNQTNQRITINTGIAFPLPITAFDGAGTNSAGAGITCGGQIYTGDNANMTGAFALSTPGVGGIHW